jgi:hypothetical protein
LVSAGWATWGCDAAFAEGIAAENGDAGMKVALGISKRQWLLVFAAVMSVVIINIIGIWSDLPSKVYTEKLGDMAPEFFDLMNCNPPYLTVFLKFLLVTSLLTAIAWFIVFLPEKPFLQRLPSVLKYASELLMAILIGGVFAVVSISFASNWVYDFWCGPLYGLLWSAFVYYWSIRLIFPVTTVLIFWAMYLSNQHYDQLRQTEVSE